MRSLDPSALTPPVPHEMVDIAGERSVGGVMAVGRPGKVGVLDVTLGVKDGRTGVSSRYVKAPMQLTRPLYIDPSGPGEAFLYIRTTGGGLAQNDRIRQVVTLPPDAQATVTTQAGTPVHRMDAGMASQWVSLHVAGGAVCEYLPGQTILFGGSRLLQTTDVEVAPGGTVLAAEVMLTGRLARGERNGFDALAQRFRVTRDGRPLLSDTLCVTGATARSEMLLARWAVWGTVLIVPASPSDVPGLLAVLRDDLPTASEQLTAVASTMVADEGITVRVAGDDPVSVRLVVEAVHGLARERLLGRPAIDLRRM